MCIPIKRITSILLFLALLYKLITGICIVVVQYGLLGNHRPPFNFLPYIQATHHAPQLLEYIL